MVVQIAVAGVIKGKVDIGELSTANLIVRCDATQQAFVRKDGTFTIRDIGPGLHEVAVVDALRWYTKALVEIDEAGKQARVVEISPPQQQNQPPIKREVKNLVLKPIAMVDYFEKRQQMSVMSLFANPMMILMVVTLGLGLLMPKMMENLDPEELKQMQQQQKAAADPSAALASLLSGKKDDAESDDE